MRLREVDALRALALLGILSVNVWYFAHPESLVTGMRSGAAETAADQLVRFATTLIFEGKSYVVFSFLFGLAFVLSWGPAGLSGGAGRRPPVGWPGAGGDGEQERRTARRLTALIILGVLHGILLFAGDILLAYGLFGFVLLGLRRIRTLWALIIAAGLFLLWCGVTTGIGLLTTALEGTPMWDQSMVPSADAEAERAAYTAGIGSYLSFQLGAYGTVAVSILLGQGPMALAAFLIGLVVGRSRLLERILRGEVTSAKLTAWMLPALALGLTLSATAAVLLWGPPGSTASRAAASEPALGAELTATGLVLLAGPIQAAGYIMGLMLLLRSRAGRPITAALAPAGQMSLTNYLTQSLVLALLFSGLGLGLAGQLAPTVVAAVVVVVWAGQLLISRLWLSRFRRGPVEIPLRAWTYRTSMRAAAAGAAPDDAGQRR